MCIRDSNTNSVARDKRLNPTKVGYGEGAWRGNSSIKPGGGTTASEPRAWGSYTQAHTIPKGDASAASGYGQGAYAKNGAGRMDGFGERPRSAVHEHEDLRGFSRLSDRGLFDPALNGHNERVSQHLQDCKAGSAKGSYETNVLTARGSTLTRLGADERHKMNGYKSAPPQATYGDGAYASPTRGGIVHVAVSRDNSKQYSEQPGGRAHFHEAYSKYLPTTAEAKTGRHFPLPEYGQGLHAVREQGAYDASFSAPSERERYNAAFSTPRSGMF
eukprot:TRINITY_DN21342_c0_g1_i2.p1 TRINITY_DN21342_c0_g1~~TRINITY_DN21342_c0_g1_i2.p1  ORF type:complete len:273 (+),score=56.80 TRINITY_DN21342_c0_g1_i2:96-914(+)